MRLPKDLRYAQLSAEQLKQIEAKSKNVVVTFELNSYVGPKENLPHFEKALAKLRKTFAHLACAAEFTSAFVLWCSNPEHKSKAGFEGMRSKLYNGWVKFLEKRGSEGLGTEEIHRETTEDFIKYLKKERGVGYSTQRGYWAAFRSLLEVMKENSELRSRLSTELAWPQQAFRRGDAPENPTETLDAVTLRALMLACRKEAIATIEEFRQLRSIITGSTPYLGDESRDDRGRYVTIESAILAAQGNRPSAHPSLGKT